MFVLRNTTGDMEDDEVTKEKEYDILKNRLYYVNREFLNKISKAYCIIKYLLKFDLHKKGVLTHIQNILVQKINLTGCQHNSTICRTVFNYLTNIIVYNMIRQINNVIKGKNLKPVPPNASFFFFKCKYFAKKAF